ncbi:hypothetical protein TRFO_23000 [Tritrichomonas foetus]|uniref:Uncharacterized protein n=1 Tax=Tritrichomonas foetus TaxID=1144522 RepID=A0A1J4KGN7_9EUKA|nr:hypothetical protein TRFO_23000 [Tritrichomonas foetus]|eukprot:OHT08485.1 hypothetical protein TRFO_23000 [Tritrichomonas foetus]
MLFNLLSLSISIPNGFHSIGVQSDHSLSIELEDQAMVLFLDDFKTSTLIVEASNDPSQMIQVQLKLATRIIQISERFVRISLSPNNYQNSHGKKIEVYFWVIPSNYCDDLLYSISAKYKMGFEFNFQNSPSDFCFFPLIFTDSKLKSQTIIRFINSSSTSRADFVKSQNQNIEISQSCKNDSKGPSDCKHSTEEPFFIKFHENSNSYFSAAFSHTLAYFQISSNDCGIDTIQKSVNGTLVDFKSPINVENTFCKNQYDKLIHFLLIFINILLFGGLVVILLHHCGILRCHSVLGFSRGAFRFRKYKARPIEDTSGDREMLGSIEITGDDVDLTTI